MQLSCCLHQQQQHNHTQTHTNEKILERFVCAVKRERENTTTIKPAKKIPLMSFYVFLRILTFVLDVSCVSLLECVCVAIRPYKIRSMLWLFVSVYACEKCTFRLKLVCVQMYRCLDFRFVWTHCVYMHLYAEKKQSNQNEHVTFFWCKSLLSLTREQ